MARGRSRAEGDAGPSGFLVVDKPAGWTSHDVVDAARRWLGTRRVGHLGTLDPLATGVLPLVVRDATKLVAFLSDPRKAYAATVRLGVETDTLDAEGRVLRRHEGPLPDEASLRAALARFVGEIEQVPPMFSAVKQGGVALHRLARRGQEVERAPRRVRVERLELVAYDPPRAGILVECSSGTYVRALAADLGTALGCGAHLERLRRLRSGPFTLAEAVTVEQIEADAARGEAAKHLRAPAPWLGLPVLPLDADAARRVLHGGEIEGRETPSRAEPARPGGRAAALDPSGELIAVLELRPDRRWWPVRVLKSAH